MEPTCILLPLDFWESVDDPKHPRHEVAMRQLERMPKLKSKPSRAKVSASMKVKSAS